MNIVETERLILRTLTAADAEDLFRIYSDPVTMKFMGALPEGYSVEFERQQIQKHITKHYEANGFGLWATVLKEKNQLIGRCGMLFQEVEGARELEVAYLIERAYWGSGLATEAARAIIRLAFERFGFERVVAFIDRRNAASIRVAEKAGMKFDREVTYKSFGRVLLYTLEAENTVTDGR
jgi:ribosomal-protein-alanine N-acetyltransferase